MGRVFLVGAHPPGSRNVLDSSGASVEHGDGVPLRVARFLACIRGVSLAGTGCGSSERTFWYPKDGDLCLARMKPEETLVEVRSDSDVQIDRQSWV